MPGDLVQGQIISDDILHLSSGQDQPRSPGGLRWFGGTLGQAVFIGPAAFAGLEALKENTAAQHIGRRRVFAVTVGLIKGFGEPVADQRQSSCFTVQFASR